MSVNEEILLGKALTQRFQHEAAFNTGSTRYVAYLPQGNKVTSLTNGPQPVDELRMFGMDMVGALNRELHHDGAWVIVLTDPVRDGGVIIDLSAKWLYQRWVILWLDEDGDVQFPVENEERLELVLSMGPDHWLEQCELAWNLWDENRKDLGAKPEQTFKRAQGETAPSAR